MIFSILLQIVQDQAGVDALKQIHDKLSSAKTISFSIKQQMRTPTNIVDSETGEILSSFEERGTRIGVIVIKGEKCAMSFSEVTASRQSSNRIVSDGKQFALSDGSTRILESPRNLRRNLNYLLSWFGVGDYWEMLAPKGEGNPRNIDDQYALGTIRAVGQNGTEPAIEYTVVHRLVPKVVHLKVKLRYDPKSFLIQARTISNEEKDGYVVNETYKDWLLDAEIPDAKFMVPDK
jgi:outer membrane lipoprotein-sorting protein